MRPPKKTPLESLKTQGGGPNTSPTHAGTCSYPCADIPLPIAGHALGGSPTWSGVCWDMLLPLRGHTPTHCQACPGGLADMGRGVLAHAPTHCRTYPGGLADMGRGGRLPPQRCAGTCYHLSWDRVTLIPGPPQGGPDTPLGGAEHTPGVCSDHAWVFPAPPEVSGDWEGGEERAGAAPRSTRAMP